MVVGFTILKDVFKIYCTETLCKSCCDIVCTVDLLSIVFHCCCVIFLYCHFLYPCYFVLHVIFFALCFSLDNARCKGFLAIGLGRVDGLRIVENRGFFTNVKHN